MCHHLLSTHIIHQLASKAARKGGFRIGFLLRLHHIAGRKQATKGEAGKSCSDGSFWYYGTMPLAPCPDCGNQCSTKAYTCPKWGRALEENELLNSKKSISLSQ